MISNVKDCQTYNTDKSNRKWVTSKYSEWSQNIVNKLNKWVTTGKKVETDIRIKCKSDIPQYTPISIKVTPVNHVSSLQCTMMVNPFVTGSLVLLTFIEIMETICEKAFKRALKLNGCQNS